ncbi:MAG: galactokinase family protein [Microthrixaceae bacterium]
MRIWAPGRVNLIGEHTDYTGGIVVPMAVQLGIEADLTPTPGVLSLRSDADDTPVELTLPAPDLDRVAGWGRFIAAAARDHGADATTGWTGSLRSTIPVGAGLSSSAALSVAATLMFAPDDSVAGGNRSDPVATARAAQRVEQAATGVPCGIMDQLASSVGRAGSALRIDCNTLHVDPVPVPDDVAVVVVHSGQPRRLTDSAYAQRRAACEEAARRIGPLRDATTADLDSITDPLLRRRARHVVDENVRADAFVDALSGGDAREAGRLMTASHVSLRDDYEVSTEVLDALVERLCASDGVFGARLTGAGFGGCVVALCRPGHDPTPAGHRSWTVVASDGATRTG